MKLTSPHSHLYPRDAGADTWPPLPLTSHTHTSTSNAVWTTLDRTRTPPRSVIQKHPEHHLHIIYRRVTWTWAHVILSHDSRIFIYTRALFKWFIHFFTRDSRVRTPPSRFVYFHTIPLYHCHFHTQFIYFLLNLSPHVITCYSRDVRFLPRFPGTTR